MPSYAAVLREVAYQQDIRAAGASTKLGGELFARKAAQLRALADLLDRVTPEVTGTLSRELAELQMYNETEPESVRLLPILRALAAGPPPAAGRADA